MKLLVACAAAAGVAALACGLLARMAPRLGLRDAAEGPEAERKRQLEPVPLVAAQAWLCAWVALALLAPQLAWPFALPLEAATLLLCSLALALAVGWLDDLLHGGLTPPWKLAGQSVAAVPLMLEAWRAAPGQPWFAALQVLLIVLWSVNVANTFDNADGALLSHAALGLAPRAPALACAALALLPFNLGASQRRGPWRAYLGDSGSHLLGLLLASLPGGSVMLWLPTLDLCAVSWTRLRAGRRPWQGDRCHLAHRLEARGLSAAMVVLVLCALSLPALLGELLARAEAQGHWRGLGLGLSALLYLCALGLTPRLVPGAPAQK